MALSGMESCLREIAAFFSIDNGFEGSFRRLPIDHEKNIRTFPSTSITVTTHGALQNGASPLAIPIARGSAGRFAAAFPGSPLQIRFPLHK